jgi:hypothetical protein
MLASNTLASVNISQSRLRLRYGTRYHSHQEDSSAASLHRQPATARAPLASRSTMASSLHTFTTPDSASDRQCSPLSQPYLPLPCQLATSELQQKKTVGPSASQPASQPGSPLPCQLAATTGWPQRRPLGFRKEARTLASSLQRRLETNGPF